MAAHTVTPLVPVLGEPVVLDGVEYRIRRIRLGGMLELSGRAEQGRTATVRLTSLAWDAIAGVWRVAVALQ